MAFDEWLFARACESPGSIMLRLYSWRPGAITFGFNQKEQTAVDRERLNGTPLIRRVTGGRALYHDPSELTYAIAVNTEGLDDDRLSGSVTRASAAVAEVLVAFLGQLGMAADYVRTSVRGHARPEYFHTTPCFDSHARNEVVVDRRKVIASAQRRVKATFFQHGSIKINGLADHPALHLPEAPNGNACSAGPLTEADFGRMAGLFCDRFIEFFGCDAVGEQLTPEAAGQVQKRLNYVRNFCLRRRNIFEHK